MAKNGTHPEDSTRAHSPRRAEAQSLPQSHQHGSSNCRAATKDGQLMGQTQKEPNLASMWPTTTLTGSSKITAVGHLETRGATHRVQDLICPLDVQTAKSSIDSPIHTEYLMETSSTGLSSSATKETNRQTNATVHPYRVGSCRENREQPVAPRRQGPWVPSPSHTWGLWGPSLFVQYPRWFESTSLRGS